MSINVYTKTLGSQLHLTSTRGQKKSYRSWSNNRWCQFPFSSIVNTKNQRKHFIVNYPTDQVDPSDTSKIFYSTKMEYASFRVALGTSYKTKAHATLQVNAYQIKTNQNYFYNLSFYIKILKNSKIKYKTS